MKAAMSVYLCTYRMWRTYDVSNVDIGQARYNEELKKYKERMRKQSGYEGTVVCMYDVYVYIRMYLYVCVCVICMCCMYEYNVCV